MRSVIPLDTCMEQIARGDTQALHALYEQARGAVYGFVLSIVRHPQDAEDIVQDTFVQIYASAGSYQGQGKPMAWVLTIARNLALMNMRERKYRSDIAWEDCERMLGEASRAVTQEDRLVLSAAMQTLAEEEMQVVVLHAVSGFKHREIAQFLGMPLSTVLSKYSRALQKLKTKLAQEEANA